MQNINNNLSVEEIVNSYNDKQISETNISIYVGRKTDKHLIKSVHGNKNNIIVLEEEKAVCNEDDKFDLGMSSYGCYKLVLDNKTNEGDEELFFTRGKKVHNKEIALKMNLKSNQVLVFKRMKGV